MIGYACLRVRTPSGSVGCLVSASPSLPPVSWLLSLLAENPRVPVSRSVDSYGYTIARVTGGCQPGYHATVMSASEALSVETVTIVKPYSSTYMPGVTSVASRS